MTRRTTSRFVLAPPQPPLPLPTLTTPSPAVSISRSRPANHVRTLLFYSRYPLLLAGAMANFVPLSDPRSPGPSSCRPQVTRPASHQPSPPTAHRLNITPSNSSLASPRPSQLDTRPGGESAVLEPVTSRQPFQRRLTLPHLLDRFISRPPLRFCFTHVFHYRVAQDTPLGQSPVPCSSVLLPRRSLTDLDLSSTSVDQTAVSTHPLSSMIRPFSRLRFATLARSASYFISLTLSPSRTSVTFSSL